MRKSAKQSPIEIEKEQSNMASIVWKGYISFGLVSFPVKMFSAARAETVHFRMLHRKDLSRVKEVYYCAEENKPIERSDIVKGYETGNARTQTRPALCTADQNRPTPGGVRKRARSGRRAGFVVARTQVAGVQTSWQHAYDLHCLSAGRYLGRRDLRS